jgi:SAM-dependent methyltransferase
MDSALREEFRAGFYSNRQAAWIDEQKDERNGVTADVSSYLGALAAGRRDFAYPGHDSAVYRLLESLVAKRGPKRGADIGCATGCFPAMQLAAGVQSCTVFEVRPTVANHPQVDVRVQDLTYAEGVEPEFDLLTCLSTIEHIGLGRYGDPIDPWGDIKMAQSLRGLLRPGGVMLISFPSGPGCVVFNQHRIYTRYRRAALFGDLRLLRRVADRPWWARYRRVAGDLLGRTGSFSQPVYVLEKPAS